MNELKVGNESTFAIESGFHAAYENLSFLALGYFVLFVGGRSYGVHEFDATMLGRAFESVRKRIASRGQHVSHLAMSPRLRPS